MEPWVKTISLPNGQTPTDLMLTPNWPDQNAGNGRCGRRSGSRLTMLCAATSAPRTALSQCSSTRNWYSYSTWGKRAMSPTTKMESVTTPLISKARQPASQPTPQKPAASPDPSSHSVLRTEPSDVSTTSHSTTLSSESRARCTWPWPSPSRDFTRIPVRRSTPWSRCISAAIVPITPPSAPTSGAVPRSTTVTGRPNSRQTEATGAGPIGLLAALIGVQHGLEVHVLDRAESGPKPALVQALGAKYHTGTATTVGFEPDIIVECTGVGSVVTDAIQAVGAGGIMCLTGVGSGGATPGYTLRTSRRRRCSKITSSWAASTPTGGTGTRPAKPWLARTARGWRASSRGASGRSTSHTPCSAKRSTSRSSFSSPKRDHKRHMLRALLRPRPQRRRDIDRPWRGTRAGDASAAPLTLTPGTPALPGGRPGWRLVQPRTCVPRCPRLSTGGAEMDYSA